MKYYKPPDPSLSVYWAREFPFTNKNVVTIGDSLLRYLVNPGATSEDRNFVSSFQKIRNYFYPGKKINAIKNMLRFDLKVDSTVQNVTLLLGTNNLCIDSVDDMILYYSQLLEVVKSKFPRAVIFCIPILPREDTNIFLTKISSFLHKLGNLCLGQRTVFCLNTVFDNFVPNLHLNRSGLHFSAEGHRYLRTAVKSALHSYYYDAEELPWVFFSVKVCCCR